MNLPNKISLSRIIMTLFIIFFCLFPFYSVNINIPKYNVEGIIVDLRYIISGVIFIIASISDFIDGRIARRNNLITDTGKILDSIADKVLVNSVLIILACQSRIHPIIPVIIITRDTIVDSIKMMASRNGVVQAAIKSGKIKTICMMSGLTLTFFYNLPFELIGLGVDQMLLFVACVLSIISCVQYYTLNKEFIFEK